VAERLSGRALVALLVALACLRPLPARGDDTGAPHAPKLEERAPAAPAGGAGDARPLPRTVAICRDTVAARCWLARSDAGCGAAPAGPYRVVIDRPGTPDVADALAACREALQR
jgi:hypothetical protein